MIGWDFNLKAFLYIRGIISLFGHKYGINVNMWKMPGCGWMCKELQKLALIVPVGILCYYSSCYWLIFLVLSLTISYYWYQGYLHCRIKKILCWCKTLGYYNLFLDQNVRFFSSKPVFRKLFRFYLWWKLNS